MLSPTTLLTEACQSEGSLEIGDGSLYLGAPNAMLGDPAGRAVDLLNVRGVRLLGWRVKPGVALWHDADGPEVRMALKYVGLANAEIHYLDDADSWVHDRLRQFVPQYVQRIREQRGLEVTPQMLVLASLKARRINEFWDEHSTSLRARRVTVATVLHGMWNGGRSGAARWAPPLRR